MKRDNLIKELMRLPLDAEIVIMQGDDLLGDYRFETSLSISKETGYMDKRGSIWTSFSNYRRIEDKATIVWVIG